MKTEYYRQVVVIGAGPAGLSVTSELILNNISVELFESDRSGGKIWVAPEVDNYPNYRSTKGTDLAVDLVNRFKNLGGIVTHQTVLRVWKEEDKFYTETDESIVTSEILVIASGTRSRILDITGIQEYFGKGIFCNAVDNINLCKDKTVAVIGGGNSALKEAVYLAEHVKHLFLIHRREEFRGLKKTLDKLLTYSNVTLMTPYTPEEILGSDGTVTELLVKNTKDDTKLKLPIDQICLSVGQIPNTEIIQIPEVKLEAGYIVTDRQMNTSVSGLFAIGDVTDRSTKQIYLSEHDGKVASKSIINYLK